MKILLIACSYPPDPTVGSFRAAKLARAFRDDGHDVNVVTSRLSGEPGGLRVEEEHLRVHTVRELPGPQAMYRRIKRSLATPPAGAEIHGANGSEQRTPDLPGWKRAMLSIVWVPDNRKGFVPVALSRSRSIVTEGIDLVYTTAPPFSSHLVGLVLKRVLRIRWVAEFRDPWTENANRRYRSGWADAVNSRLERACVSHADKLVAVSEGIRDLLVSKLPEDRRGDVVLALNGIDNLLPTDDTVARAAGPFRIVHLGNCYAGRDPRPFLYALSNLVRRKGLSPTDIRVDFIGHCRRYEGESLELLVQDVGLSGIVEFEDWMPQDEARARGQSADLFLLPFPKLGLIPNKLYDYLGFRKPILAFVHADGEAARLLRKLGGHYLVTEGTVDAAERALESALAACRHETRSDEVDTILSELTTEQQMRKLLRSLFGSQMTAD